MLNLCTRREVMRCLQRYSTRSWLVLSMQVGRCKGKGKGRGRSRSIGKGRSIGKVRRRSIGKGKGVSKGQGQWQALAVGSICHT